MVAANRFRLQFFSINSGNVSAQHIEFRDTIGGASVCVGGTARSSGAYPGTDIAACFADTGIWASNGGGFPYFVEYQFAPGVTHDIVEIAYQAREDGYPEQTPNWSQLLYEDGVNTGFWRPASEYIYFGNAAAWSVGETKIVDLVPAGPSAELDISQGRLFASAGGIASEVRTSEARVLVHFNYPADFTRSSEARAMVSAKKDVVVDASAARIFTHVSGRISDPKLRVWTFTLDGHDFFVLRLGDDTTLLYDLYSEQWIEWDSKSSGAWRPNCGITWVGGQALADVYGSAVVAGDDTFGLLWFLDADQPFDDNPDPERPQQQVDFTRIVTGQVLASGRQYLPCWSIFLDGDNYGNEATDFVPSIVLEYSDDQGRNFVSADVLGIETDLTVDNPYKWDSLGQISSPGRMFRVVDTGVLTRIDSMSMNDDDG